MPCSFPIYREWLNAQFGDLCENHDRLYVTRNWVLKVSSDFEFCSLMAARGYTLLAFGAFAYFTTFGTAYWLWKKHKARLRAAAYACRVQLARYSSGIADSVRGSFRGGGSD